MALNEVLYDKRCEPGEYTRKMIFQLVTQACQSGVLTENHLSLGGICSL